MNRASKLLANPSVASRLALAAMTVSLAAVSPWGVRAATQSPQSESARTNPATTERQAALKAFTERLKSYVDAKKKLEDGLPAMKPGAVSTGAADTHQTILADRLRDARAGAKPGDLFGDAAPAIKAIIQQDMKTRGVADAFALIQEGPSQAPVVNAAYPEKAALATVPPLLLVNLPRLPDGLEYRFMGRDLILRDRTANLIVDFIAGAVPPARRQG